MSQMLTYPGFSVVFIQTFSVHHTKEFILPKEAEEQMYAEFEDYDEKRHVYIEKADALRTPIAWVERDIENQIFVLPKTPPCTGMCADTACAASTSPCPLCRQRMNPSTKPRSRATATWR